MRRRLVEKAARNEYHELMLKNKTNIKKRYIGVFIALVAVVGLVSTGTVVTALVETDVSDTAQRTVASQTDEAKQKLEAAREAAKQRNEASREAAKQQAETARTEAKERLAVKQQEIRIKLDTARKERCEAREERINRIVAKATEQSQKHLEVFQSIEAKVTTFYVEKQLTVANYDSLQAAVDEKEAAAIAAIQSTDAVSLDCDTEGAGREIGTFVRSSVQDLHVALKAYRTAIKDLIVAAKQANDAVRTDDAADTQTEGEGQ